MGLRIDYLSLSINATEILLFFLIIAFIFRRGINKTFSFVRKPFIVLTACLVVISIVISAHPLAGIIKLALYMELLFLALYIIKEKPSFDTSINILILVGFLTSLLALIQFYLQGSVGGLLYFLGERSFTISTPGIARGSINGVLFLRPYATFPHPNVLAGFLTLLLPYILYRFLQTKEFNKTIIFFTLYILFLSTIVLTMSRISFTVSLLGVIVYVLLRVKRSKQLTHKIILPVFILSIITFLPININRFISFITLQDSSFSERIVLTKASLIMSAQHPFVGVGLNNFIFHLSQFLNTKATTPLLQPVHNTYLLILSELGIIGLFLFLYLLLYAYKQIQKKHPPLTMLQTTSLFQIILLLAFDHYFYTLWQSSLLFTVFIAFMIVDNTTHEKNKAFF